MATSDLTLERLREVLHYDPETGIFTWLVRKALWMKGAGNEVTCRGNHGYIDVRVDGKRFLGHRLAWFYMTGKWPLGQIDHINGIRGDDRWKNLRDVSHSDNQQNRRLPARNNRSTGLLGVGFDKRYNKFRARIFYGGRCYGLGYYDTAEEAHAAYVAAKRLHHPGCTI